MSIHDARIITGSSGSVGRLHPFRTPAALHRSLPPRRRPGPSRPDPTWLLVCVALATFMSAMTLALAGSDGTPEGEGEAHWEEGAP